MGHLINPISFRLVYYPLFKNVDYNFFSTNLIFFNYLIVKRYIKIFFNRKELVQSGWILNSIDIKKKGSSYIVWLYLYNRALYIFLEIIHRMKNKSLEQKNLLKFLTFVKNEIILWYLFFFDVLKKKIKIDLYPFYKKVVDLNIFLMRKNVISAEVLIQFIKKRLEQHFWIGKILNQIRFTLKKELPILHIVSENLQLLGFRVKCSGRFSKKQRASTFLISGGKVPLSTVSSFIDYSMDFLPLKFGACGLKVWLYWSRPYKIKNDFFYFF